MTNLEARIIAGAGLFQAATFAIFLAMAAYVIPFWDTLDWIDAYVASDSVAQWLWQQHADVRQPVTKAILWLDLRLFQGKFYPIAALCAFGMLLSLIAIARLTARSTTTPFRRAAGFGVPLIIGFQSFTLPAYMETSLIQHVLVVIFAIGAVWPLIRATPESQPTPRAHGVSMVGAILASLTFPNGHLVWPILAWLAWRRGSAGYWSALYLAAGAVIATIYFSGLIWDGPVSGSRSEATPLGVAVFVIEFFGVPWVRLPALYPLGICVSGALMVAALHIAFRVGRRYRAHDPVGELALTLLLFTIGTAFMIAITRSDFLDLRTQGTRYGIYAAMAQLALALYFLPRAGRLATQTARHTRVFALIGFLALAGFAAQQITIGEKAAQAGHTMVELRNALRTGDATPDMLAKLYPDQARATNLVDLLRRHGWYGLGTPNQASMDSSPLVTPPKSSSSS